MLCFKCGHDIPSDSHFCHYCGTKLEYATFEEDAANFQNTSPAVLAADSPCEVTQNAVLLHRAYKAYLSEDPEERHFFESMCKSAQLKDAYLEEQARNKQEHDKGVSVSYKQTYIDFLDFLHKECFGLPVDTTSPASATNKTHVTTAAARHGLHQTHTEQRYCKLCGQAINRSTKRCTGCGKRYAKSRFWPLYAVLTVILLIGVYTGSNYFCAVSAMNNQKFTQSKWFFDNLFVSETLFPDKYAYAEAGALLEKGKYTEALRAFDKVAGVPDEIKESLRSEIYTVGQEQYRSGNMSEAEEAFHAVGDYERSRDYLRLIDYHDSNASDRQKAIDYYQDFFNLMDLEDTAEIILKNDTMFEMFLFGLWEDNSYLPYYFEMKEDSDGYYSRCNLPEPKRGLDYYRISKGIYYIEDDGTTSEKCYEFSIIDKDTIQIYCFANKTSHIMHRQ